MTKEDIEKIVFESLKDYCTNNGIEITSIDHNTPLLGSNRVLDSIGMVNLIVDIEMAFQEKEIEISLTSEAAMSNRISPFRTIGSLCNFIANQLENDR